MRVHFAPALLFLLGNAASAQTPACPTTTSCADVASFVATVTDFRQSISGYDHVITATVRFRNKTSHPLILGYVSGSGVVTDDQGIRYGMYPSGVHAIGLVSGTTFDSKFTLQPGETSDARFDFGWRPTKGAIFGTSFVMDLGIREIDPVGANQYRLGREHALHYSGFGAARAVAAVPPSSPPAGAEPATPAQVPSPTPAAADPCEGKSRCFGSGPFIAQVSSLTSSTVGVYKDRVLEAMVRFTNLSSQPLVLSYVARSSGMVDDRGNRYWWGRAGTYDNSVKGIGTTQGNKVDPSFILKPGESRDAKFTVWTRPGRAILGTTYAFDFTVNQLELLPANQIRVTREFAVSFRDLAPGGANLGAAAVGTAQSLVDQLAKKIKKP